MTTLKSEKPQNMALRIYIFYTNQLEEGFQQLCLHLETKQNEE